LAVKKPELKTEENAGLLHCCRRCCNLLAGKLYK
jgi:hypothetical protein